VSDSLVQMLSVFLGMLGSSALVIVTYYFGPGGYLRKKNHLDDPDEKE